MENKNKNTNNNNSENNKPKVDAKPVLKPKQPKLPRQKSGIGQKIKAGLILTTIVAGSAAAGFFANKAMQPAYQVVESENQLYLTGDNINQPLFIENDSVVVGSADYATAALQANHGDNAINEMAIYSLDNSQALNNNSLDRLMDVAKATMLGNKDYTVQFLESSLDALPLQSYSTSTRQMITNKFAELGEQQPTLFDDLGENFKSYAAQRTYKGLGEQIKNDAQHLWDNLTGSEGDSTKQSDESNMDKLRQGYNALKKKISGDR